jgi:hypothetical protein
MAFAVNLKIFDNSSKTQERRGTVDFLLAWYNLIFLIPILVGIVASLALAAGFGGEVGEGSAEVEAGEGETDDITDHDGSSDGHSDHSMLQQALSLLGVGKVPLSIVIMLSSLSFGIAGMLSNAVLGGMIGSPRSIVLVSLVSAFCAMLFITANCAKAMSKIVPSFETRTVSQRDFLGMQAHLILPASPFTGLAHIRDQHGNLHQIRCKTSHGEISDGVDVMVFDYEEQEGVYLVEEIPTLKRAVKSSPSLPAQKTSREGGLDESTDTQSATQQRKITE